MEQLNTKSIDQAAKSDAFENDHANTKTDSSANGGNFLKKDSHVLIIDQNSEVDNEFCSSPNQEPYNSKQSTPENMDKSSNTNQSSTQSPTSSAVSDENDKANTGPSTNINAKYNNNFLQITGAKIMTPNDNEPANKETKSGRRSRNLSFSDSPVETNFHDDEFGVDPVIVKGTQLMKVSAKKRHKRKFRIDVDQGRILWDSKKSGKVNIENIKELRIGEAIRNYRIHFKLGSDVEDRWFTIIYVEAGKYKTLHLLADSLDLFNKWVDNLQRLYLHRKDMMGGLGHLRKRHSIWLKQHWKQANKDGDSKLVFDEVARLCRQLNINMSRQLLKAKFNEADEQRNGWLDFVDFQRFVRIIKHRPELVDLFESLAKTRRDILTPQEFKDFLLNTQKCNLKEKEYDNIYYKFCDKDRNEMNLEGFSSFLMSSDNPIFAPEHAKVFQDMNQPLNHYFVDSSHNTYLLGHQLTGESSVEGYIRVLQGGCRCVEIDCWDGPDGPIVTHGHTLTSKILFQDAISAIRTYAFKSSPYPLILSLEVHCSVEQQNQMASILTSTLGDQLVTEFFSENETELPSPENLMYRILLKGKNLPPDASEDSFDSATDTESAESDVEKDNTDRNKAHPRNKSSVAKALSDLVVYCSAVKFKGFEYHREKSRFNHMSSFSERFSTRLSKTDKHSFIQHNSRHLSRIYPTGLRISSSNYEPHHQWMVGNQIVALNWQTFDLGMQINQAMFSVNGRCGYVLKPERMRNVELETPTKTPIQTLEIEIISAQQLPRPKDVLKGEIIDPFVEVELLVPGADVIKKKTKTITDNGFNPIWTETLTFTIDFDFLELVFLRFTVWDEDVRTNDFIASYCIPVASLQQGYRHIPLNDASGEQYLFTTLFVRLSLTPNP